MTLPLSEASVLHLIRRWFSRSRPLCSGTSDGTGVALIPAGLIATGEAAAGAGAGDAADATGLTGVDGTA